MTVTQTGDRHHEKPPSFDTKFMHPGVSKSLTRSAARATFHGSARYHPEHRPARDRAEQCDRRDAGITPGEGAAAAVRDAAVRSEAVLAPALPPRSGQPLAARRDRADDIRAAPNRCTAGRGRNAMNGLSY